MTLFDLTPLSPAEVVRHKGYHPATMLPLDPDENHTCGNCARRRRVWIVGRVHNHGDRWETVCDVVSPSPAHFGKLTVLEDSEERISAGEFCAEDCCCAECCAESARDVELDGYDPHPAWPWESAVEDWMPACERWWDLEAERVLQALKGKR